MRHVYVRTYFISFHVFPCFFMFLFYIDIYRLCFILLLLLLLLLLNVIAVGVSLTKTQKTLVRSVTLKAHSQV